MARKRNSTRCFWCHAPGGDLTRDHVVPLAFGGSDDAANVVRACRACNEERGRVVCVAVQVFATARRKVRERTRRKVLAGLLALRPVVEKWGAIERKRLGGRSVTDKLGTAAHPFPTQPVGRQLAEATLRAARKRAEAAPLAEDCEGDE